MTDSSNATIYLADQRGVQQTGWFRSFNTFNFGAYSNADKEPFGILQVVNDETLAGNKQLSMRVEQNTEIVLLPVAGTISYKNTLNTYGTSRNNRDGEYLEVGQCHIFSETQNSIFEITNPYETELVNFLQIWFTSNTPNFQPTFNTFLFDLEKNKNQLLPLFTSQNADIQGFIGQYIGRSEAIYKVENPKNGVFIFIIEGAFEVQNRLLESRDGLSLSNTEYVEFEALSDGAVLILIELPLNN